MSRSPLTIALLLIYAAAILLLLPLSWAGEIYGWGTQSLLSSNGLSWLICQLLPAARTAPWAETTLLLVSLSMIIHSGLANNLRPHTHRSLRQQRALQAVSIFIIFTLLLLLILFTTHSPLLISPLGTLRGSPIHQSLLTLILLYICLLSLIHGIAVGRFLSLNDTLHAATHLPIQANRLIIILPITAILITALTYAFPQLLSLNSYLLTLYSFPIIAQLIDIIRTRS